jgi:hypothetical protein
LPPTTATRPTRAAAVAVITHHSRLPAIATTTAPAPSPTARTPRKAAVASKPKRAPARTRRRVRPRRHATSHARTTVTRSGAPTRVVPVSAGSTRSTGASGPTGGSGSIVSPEPAAESRRHYSQFGLPGRSQFAPTPSNGGGSRSGSSGSGIVSGGGSGSGFSGSGTTYGGG